MNNRKECRAVYHSGSWEDVRQQQDEKLRQHLRECPFCQKRLNQWEEIHTWLKEYGKIELPAGWEEKMINRILSRQRVSSFGRLVLAGTVSVAVFILFGLIFRLTGSKPVTVVKNTLPVPGIEESKTQQDEAKIPGKKAGAESKTLAEKSGDRQKVESKLHLAQIAKEPLSEPEEKKEKTEDAVSLRKEMEKFERTDVSSLSREEVSARSVSGFGLAGNNAVQAKRAGKVQAADQLPPYLLIKEKSQLEKIWSAGNLSAPLPAVDFKKQLVLVLPSVSGEKRYQIVALEEKDNVLVISYIESSWEKDKKEILPPYQIFVVNQLPQIEFQKVERSVISSDASPAKDKEQE